MDRLGYDFFTAAVFAQHEHGQIGAGHAAHDRPHSLDLRAFSHEFYTRGGLLGNLAVGGNQFLPVLGGF